MWSYNHYQRELDWKDPFHAVLGAYIELPSQTVLWRNKDYKNTQLYQFSARSDKCCIRDCSNQSLRLIDFRYALQILYDSNVDFVDEVYSPENIGIVCMYVKEMSKNELMEYVIDGIIICTESGIHIVLFELDCVEECIEQTQVSLGKDVEYIEPPNTNPLRITSLLQNHPPRLFVVGESNPISGILMECSIGDLCNTLHIPKISVKLETMGARHPNFLFDNKETMPTFQSIKWKETFPPVYGSFIEIPAYTIFWRGYDTLYPAISERPVYFGEYAVAKEYAQTSPSHTLGLFVTSKPIKVLDIRFLKVLLTDLFYGFGGNAVTKTTIAFGLSSFRQQLRLMQEVYESSIRTGKDVGYNAMKAIFNDSIEQPGVRVAETSNDGWVMAFLGEVFNGIADGFIAPQLFTPYQVNTNNQLHPELILFNPVKSGIVQINHVPQSIPVSVYDLISRQFPSPITLRAQGMETKYVGRGGGSFIPPVESFNDLLNQGDKNTVKLYTEAVKEGKQFRKRCKFSI